MLAIWGLVALLGLVLISTWSGRQHAYIALLVGCFFLLPRVLLGSSPLDATHVGIAAYEPRLMTYTAALLLVAVGAVMARQLKFGLLAPLLVFLILWTALVWSHSSPVFSGAIHLATGALAWASNVVAGSPRNHAILLAWLAGVIALQAGVCALQFIGVPLFANSGTIVEDVSLTGRAGGTLGHPSGVGKAMSATSPTEQGRRAAQTFKSRASHVGSSPDPVRRAR
jgi:hypothetical protein